MFKELSQLGSLLQQAQSLPGKMQAAKERLAAAEYTGRSADGRVEVQVSGEGVVTGCSLAGELQSVGMSEEQVRQIEQNIVAAMNAALLLLKQRTAEEMGAVTGGLDLGSLGSALGQMGLGPKG